MFYVLEPEVAGGFGEECVLDNTTHPPTVTKLHYVFEGWLGDELLETFPCYIATESACDVLGENQLTGFEVDEVTVTTSETFEELHPGQELPAFRWLRIVGRAGIDDFGCAEDHRLVVSDRAMQVLNASCRLDQCDVEER